MKKLAAGSLGLKMTCRSVKLNGVAPRLLSRRKCVIVLAISTGSLTVSLLSGFN